MSLGDLVISLSANTASLASDMGKANQIMERFAYKAIQSAKQGEDAIKAMSRESSALVLQLNAMGPVADRLQYAFNNLNIKSAFQIDAEKARIIASFNMIKNSGVATFSEIARANEAMQSKLDLLDGKINKNTEGMNLFGLASVAAIAKIQILYSLINTVMSAIGQAPGIAIDAVERFNSQVVGNAAMITSMQRGVTDIGIAYQKNKGYTEAVQEVLVKMDAETSASAKNLQDMNSQFQQQGILINANNKKQVEGFKSVANALAAITANDPNKDLQYGQEIRALREMKDIGSNRLVQLLASQGVTKEIFENWKKIGNETKNYGYVLEKLAPYLQGFAAAQGDINAMWETIKSTTTTIRDDILRKGFDETLKEIGFLVSRLNDYWKENADVIIGKVQQGLMIAKGLIETVSILLKGPIGGAISLISSLVLKISEGWGIIAVSVLPEVSNQFNHISKLVGNILFAGGSLGAVMLSGLGSVAQAIVQLGKGAWKAIKGDFEGAKGELYGITETASAKALNSSMLATKNALKNASNAYSEMSSGSSRILDRYDKFKAAGNYKGNGEKSFDFDEYFKNLILNLNKSKDKSKPVSVSDYNSFVSMYSTMLDNAEPDEFLRKVEQIDTKFAELQFRYSKLSASEKSDFDTKYKSIALLKEEVQQRAITEQADKREKAWNVEMKQFQEEAVRKQKEALRIEKEKAEEIKKQAQEARAISESEINNKIANIEALQKFGEITTEDAVTQLLDQYQSKLSVQKQFLSSIDVSKHATAWLTEQHNIDRTVDKILELRKTLFDISPLGGMTSALKDYSKAAIDLGAQVKNVTTSMLTGMENAMVNFVQTGKLSFKDLANSIINDLIRIAIRASITGPLSNALSGLIGGMFGSSGSMINSSSSIGQGISSQFPNAAPYTTYSYAGFSAAGGFDIPSGVNPLVQTHAKEMILPEKYADVIRDMSSSKTSSTGGNVIINIDNQTGQQVEQKNNGTTFDGENYVVSIILKNVANNGPLRGLMAGAM